MSNIDTQNIKVLNYNEIAICVDTLKEKYIFNASRDGITPTIVQVPLNDLQFIYSNTKLITTGWLTFDEDEKEEIFKMLRFADWQNVLTNKDIRDILVNPTRERLQRIINIDNITYFDRVKTAMFELVSDGVDVTAKVSRLVEQRYKELQLKQRVSSIVLTDKTVEKNVSSEEVKALNEQNKLLQQQLDEMKEMMEQIMAANQNKAPVETVAPAVDPKSNATVKKPVGRPKKS